MMQLTKSNKLILKSVLFCTIFAFCLSGCKGKGDGKIGDLPGNFNSMTTAQKMDTLFAMYPVNEVAEFICDAAQPRISQNQSLWIRASSAALASS